MTLCPLRGGIPRLGAHKLIEGDVVVADADGVNLLPVERAEQVMVEALAIQALVS